MTWGGRHDHTVNDKPVFRDLSAYLHLEGLLACAPSSGRDTHMCNMTYFGVLVHVVSRPWSDSLLVNV